MCEPAQSKCTSTFSQEQLCTHIYRKNVAPQNLGPHFVRACAVEMHLCTSTFQISQGPLIRKFTGKCRSHPQPKTTGQTLCEPARSKCTATFSQEPLYTEICRKNAAPQNLGPHFVRACAVEMHFNISQEPLYIYGNSQVKCRRPEARTTLCASLRGRKALQHVTRATLDGILQEKCRAPEPRTALLCEPAQSKFM